MKLLGIEFINEPLERRLETLAAAAWFGITTFFGHVLVSFLFYLLFTQLWWIPVAYACWVYFDKDVCEKGGRPVEWIQNLAWWRYMKNYFSPKLILDPELHLDYNKNYLFCCFPHGVLPSGGFCNISSVYSDFKKIYPDFQVKISALRQLFFLPITREVGLGLGGISCSARSLTHVLSNPKGGNIINLFPGGAAEAFYAKPNQYIFVVRNRKGFVKVALKTGAAIVPVISFGDLDAFDQVQHPIIIKIQNFVKKYFGFVPVIPIGRGFFQNSFGLIPRRSSVTTVGRPISITKTENPTQEKIDEVHQKFMDELADLFQKYKHKCLKNPDVVIFELK